MLFGWENLSLRRPSRRMIEDVLQQATREPYNHDWVGSTEDAPPLPEALKHGGWVLDHNRVQVGSGREDYLQARRMLERWDHMHLGWVGTNSPPVAAGQRLCVYAQSLWLWTRMPLRIVYRKEGRAKLTKALQPAIDRAATSPRRLTAGRRFTFASATVRGHQLEGEERFSVEWHRDDNSVWYEIYTVSRPATPLAWLTYPVVRLHQQRFARFSMNAVRRALQPCKA